MVPVEEQASQELYLQVHASNYKLSKSNILNSQADLLMMLKHAHNINLLKKQKRDLRLRLLKQYRELDKLIDIFKRQLPEPNVPTKFKKESLKPKEVIPVVRTPRKSKEQAGQFDDELQKIHAKLKELNS